MPILEVLVFRGTGGVYNREHPYYQEDALVRAGHYGILGLFDDGRIIGFHPTEEAGKQAGGEEALLKALQNKEAQPGRLQIDNAYFDRAYELIAETEGRTTVYSYDVEVTQETLEQIRSWYTEGKESLYNFPDADGNFDAEESNCAMFWLTWFEIPLPKQTGSIKELVEIMKDEGYNTWRIND